MLADLGANVIKLEDSTIGGDAGRGFAELLLVAHALALTRTEDFGFFIRLASQRASVTLNVGLSSMGSAARNGIRRC